MRAARSLAPGAVPLTPHAGSGEAKGGPHTPRPVIVDGGPAALALSSDQVVWRPRTKYSNLDHTPPRCRPTSRSGSNASPVDQRPTRRDTRDAEDSTSEELGSTDDKDAKRQKARQKVMLELGRNPTLPSRRAPRRISNEDLETEERADTEATPPNDDAGGGKKGDEDDGGDQGVLTSEADSERGREWAEMDGGLIGGGEDLDMFGMDVVGDLGKGMDSVFGKRSDGSPLVAIRTGCGGDSPLRQMGVRSPMIRGSPTAACMSLRAENLAQKWLVETDGGQSALASMAPARSSANQGRRFPSDGGPSEGGPSHPPRRDVSSRSWRQVDNGDWGESFKGGGMGIRRTGSSGSVAPLRRTSSADSVSETYMKMQMVDGAVRGSGHQGGRGTWSSTRVRSPVARSPVPRTLSRAGSPVPPGSSSVLNAAVDGMASPVRGLLGGQAMVTDPLSLQNVPRLRLYHKAISGKTLSKNFASSAKDTKHYAIVLNRTKSS